MPKKKTTTPKNKPDMQEEFLVLGHLIKYNLYMLTKSVVFSAVASKVTNLDDAVAITNRLINELDLDTKRKIESQQAPMQ